MLLNKRLFRIIAVSIVFTYFFLFPFGQLLRLETHVLGKAVSILAVDVIASLSLLYFMFIKKPGISGYFYSFFLVCIFSLTLSLNYFSINQVLASSFYLARILIYFSFFVLSWNLAKIKPVFKRNIILILTASLVLASILGWLQYLIFPDLTFLKFSGWDDHLGRLVGTYLDPAYTGIIFVMGFFITFIKYINAKKIFNLIMSLLFLMSLLFTYSRASYIALITGLIILLIIKKKIRSVVLIFLAVFIMAIPFLPRGEGEGVKLERTRSAVLRLGNYQETFEIVKNYPLFGTGFNNLCNVRSLMYSDNPESHSCSGSDSSLLLVAATTGIVGFLIFLNLMHKILNFKHTGYYETLIKVFLPSLFMHSFFSNSLFYPWVMGAVACLMAVSFKE